MSQYLLSTYAVEGEVPGAPPTPEEMQEFMGRLVALEADMDSSGTFVFGGALHGPDATTVVRINDGDVVMTDGPFAGIEGAHRRVLSDQRRRSRRSAGLGRQSRRRNQPPHRGSSVPSDRSCGRSHGRDARRMRA